MLMHMIVVLILVADALAALPLAVDEGELVEWDGGRDHVEHGAVRRGALTAGVPVATQSEGRAEVPEAVQAAVGRGVIAVLEVVGLQQLVSAEPLGALLTGVWHCIVFTVPGHVPAEVLPTGEVESALPARVDPVTVALEEGVDLLLAEGPLTHQVLMLVHRGDDTGVMVAVGWLVMGGVDASGFVAGPRHEWGVGRGLGVGSVVEGGVGEKGVCSGVDAFWN